MNRIYFAICITATLFACNSGIDQNMSKQATPATQNTTLPAAGATAQPSTTITTAATGAVNPPHGQPGHSCDIAVGAPLNGAAGAQSRPVSAAPVSPTLKQPALNTLPQAGSAQQTVRLNPAHGQPGHDCAVEVGKPLSK